MNMTREEKNRKQIKADPEKYCEYCGQKMHRVRFNSGRLEDMTAFIRRKYCSRDCMRKAFIKKGEDTKQGYSTAHHSSRMLAYIILEKEYKCERCGSTRNVDVHHKDGNFSNNTPENLVVLCRSCHAKEHQHKSLCKICGKPAKGHGLCEKHLIRYRKYGNPLMCYHKIVEK